MISQHFKQRVYERLDSHSAKRLIAMLHASLNAGQKPTDGKHEVQGYGIVIVRDSSFVTFLAPGMVAV
jgi:hypothetical protein